MHFPEMRWTRALAVSLALPLAACGPSLAPDVTTLSDIVGPDLPGAQGKTVEDQDRIDSAMAGLCRTAVIPADACDLHGERSEARRAELGR